MARLNARPSYRSSNIPSSRLPSATPGLADASDQENHDPRAQKRDKGKQRAGEAPRSATMPTPESGDGSEVRGQKRKRNREHAREDHDESGDEDDEFTKEYDPNQDPDARRKIMRESRLLEREFQERRDDFMRDQGEGLTKTVHEANNIYRKVKRTGDATSDSRLMVNVSDLANKKTARLVLGDSSTGIDVDEFLAKCITYMRHGGPANDIPTSTQRRRHRGRSGYDEDDDTIGEMLNFEFLGQNACFPYNSRPCVPTFLLGPLSVEKKVRMQTQRRARQSKDTSGKAAQPEALTRADISQSDENGLTAICTRIRNQLVKHVDKAEQTLSEAGFSSMEDLHSDRGKALMRKCRISDTGGVSLFEYVVNPRSFGQTVENMFYVSFLIKEGSFGVSQDSQGLPTISAATPSTLDEQRKNNTSKHQAVLSLDYSTWQSLIKAFDIRNSMIPHREEDNTAQIGERGWYT